MPRKHTPDQSTIQAEVVTVTAAPESTDHNEERATFVERVGRKGQRTTAPDPFGIAGDYVAGVRLFESKQDRQMAIQFDDRPGQPVIDKLKEAGYRWRPTDRVWTHPVRQESAMGTRIEAERLYQNVRQMVRREKGVEIPDEIPF